MFFLMFLGLSAVVSGLGLAISAPARRRLGIYSGLSLLFALLGLFVFVLFSWWTGIFPMRFGEGSLITYSVSFPHDFVERGALGVAVLSVGILGGLSPVLAAWLVSWQSATRSMA